MKKMIRKRLTAVILATMLLSLFLNFFLQVYNARNDMYLDAQSKIWQIEQILKENEADTERAKQDLKADCFIRAKAAAYITENNPEITGNLSEIRKIAGLLQVDELHFFDTEGNLFSGSQPQYYGLNFNSGEQMQFFLPMLEDQSLQLCQDITPNTAEQKMMQYAAVWREDGEGIVQIGLEPTRVLESMKKNELSYIFSMVTAESGSAILAVDPESNWVLGSTDETLAGNSISKTGLAPEKIRMFGRGFTGIVNGEKSYCVFVDAGSVILGVVRENRYLYHDVNRSTQLVALYLAIIALIMFLSISRYIDKYIVDGISSINEKLMIITNGNLDTRVEVDSTPEFGELSSHINLMVASVLDTTNKLSKILDVAKVPIGVYEYNRDMKRVMATSRVADILMLSDEEEQRLLSDYSLFEKKLEEIRRNPLDQERGVYMISKTATRYIKMEVFSRDHSKLGMLMDVTDDIMERQQIERERDIDLVTGIYSRRAFYKRIEELFENSGQLKNAIMMMADADNLKGVNDRYGHDIGDRYLHSIAEILRSCDAESKITARLSGDEFVLFIYGCPDKETLSGYVECVQKRMEEASIRIDGDITIPVRFSAGCAFYPGDALDCKTLLSLADERMYQMKKMRKS